MLWIISYLLILFDTFFWFKCFDKAKALKAIFSKCDVLMIKVLRFVSHRWRSLANEFPHPSYILSFTLPVNLKFSSGGLHALFNDNLIGKVNITDLELIKWTRDNGFPWNKDNKSVCLNAALHGQREWTFGMKKLAQMLH